MPVLRHALTDVSGDVRRIGVGAVSFFVTAETAADLLRAARDEDWQVRHEAVLALGKYGGFDGIIPGLLAALDDPHWEVVEAGLISLCKLRAPVAGQAARFFGHALADVRIAAAVAAGEAGDHTFESQLAGLERDPDTGVQKAAARALARLRQPAA